MKIVEHTNNQFILFDTTSVIQESIHDQSIDLIDDLLANEPQVHGWPTFQTARNLFGIDHFDPYRFTFIQACMAMFKLHHDVYIPASGSDISNAVVKTECRCYMDYWDNYKLKNRDEQWHIHEGSTLSGIFYLRIPDSMNKEICGTEFLDPDIYIEPQINHWLIFPSGTLHRPGVADTNDRRYVLAADLSIRYKEQPTNTSLKW